MSDWASSQTSCTALTSIYHGVSYARTRDTHTASLKVDGKQYYIGEWEDELEAARQVDSSEVRLAGR